MLRIDPKARKTGAPELMVAIHNARNACDESQWQTMGSAPKDGTIILGYTDEGIMRLVAWDNKVGWLNADAGPDDMYSSECTHWMPLPDEPEVPEDV
jgi:hypothetical protein